MNEVKRAVVQAHEEPLVLKRYVIGFVGSVGLTLAAWLLATHGRSNMTVVVVLLTLLALIQFMVQMVFFLHIGEERRPRWKLGVLAFMLCVVLILVIGSLWIMNNLNYRMTPEQMRQYLKSQDNL